MVEFQPSKLAAWVRFPSPAPIKCALSSVDRVPGYEPVGRRFESFRARHDCAAEKHNAWKPLRNQGFSPFLRKIQTWFLDTQLEYSASPHDWNREAKSFSVSGHFLFTGFSCSIVRFQRNRFLFRYDQKELEKGWFLLFGKAEKITVTLCRFLAVVIPAAGKEMES